MILRARHTLTFIALSDTISIGSLGTECGETDCMAAKKGMVDRLLSSIKIAGFGNPVIEFEISSGLGGSYLGHVCNACRDEIRRRVETGSRKA